MTIDEPEPPSAAETDQVEDRLSILPKVTKALARGDKVWISKSEPGGPTEREYEDLMLRRVPRAIAHRFRGAAGARGFTHAQYLTALVTLHETLREHADNGDESAKQQLEALGLGTVSI
jgi:hypothetical protein